MNNCQHIVTRYKKGETGSFCVNCNAKVFEIETNICGNCRDFNNNICSKFLMSVPSNMHVNYKISEGTCFNKY